VQPARVVACRRDRRGERGSERACSSAGRVDIHFRLSGRMALNS
jgi:hypothetical protein